MTSVLLLFFPTIDIALFYWIVLILMFFFSPWPRIIFVGVDQTFAGQKTEWLSSRNYYDQ
jgi:hypothetical protein